MASELGSDTPFCISGGTQFCFGRGERLEPIQLLNFWLNRISITKNIRGFRLRIQAAIKSSSSSGSK